MDTRGGTVKLRGEPVDLTRFEKRLLQFLLHRAGRVVSRTEIADHIYRQEIDRDSNTLEVIVRRLRLKLGMEAIETVRGAGYRMALKSSDASPLDVSSSNPRGQRTSLRPAPLD